MVRFMFALDLIFCCAMYATHPKWSWKRFALCWHFVVFGTVQLYQCSLLTYIIKLKALRFPKREASCPHQTRHVFAVMCFTATLSGGIHDDTNMCERVGWGIFWSYINRHIINHSPAFAEWVPVDECAWAHLSCTCVYIFINILQLDKHRSMFENENR